MAESELPEFYVDQFHMNVGPYGTAITFGLAAPHPTAGQATAQDTVRLRMSLEHMKIMTIIFKRNLKAYEVGLLASFSAGPIW